MSKFLSVKKILVSLILVSGALGLSGCDTFRNTLGLDHYQPDEFQVQEHPPLSMPKDYSLRPPKSPEPAGQQQNMSTKKAEAALTGKQPNKTTSGKIDKNAQGLIDKANAGDKVDPNIRETVDKEAESEPKTALEAKLAEIKKNATTLNSPNQTNPSKPNDQKAK